MTHSGAAERATMRATRHTNPVVSTNERSADGTGRADGCQVRGP